MFAILFYLSPEPPQIKKVKIAPFRYRFTTQFYQLINAALFCAAFARRVKGHPQSRDKKARLRIALHPPPQENTAVISKALSPTPARRPAGRGQGKGANPSRPLPLRFLPEQKNSGVSAARVFKHFLQAVTPAFLAPHSPAHKSPIVKRRKNPS